MDISRVTLAFNPAQRIGYIFLNEHYNNVGGAASTMHYASRAQRKANELNKRIYTYFASGNLWHEAGIFEPKE